MVNVKTIIIGTILLVIAIFSGAVLEWQFDKDYVSLSRDGEIIAKEKWTVEVERTYFTLNSWYRKNVMRPRIEKEGGYRTATRCYYPPGGLRY